MILALMLISNSSNLDKNASNQKENINLLQLKKSINKIAKEEASKEVINKTKAFKASQNQTAWDPLGISKSTLTKVWIPSTLYESLSSLLSNTVSSNKDFVEWVSLFSSRLPLTYPYLKKQDDVDTFQGIQADYIKFIKGKDKSWKNLPDDYRYFGKFNNNKENLTEFLKNNPFFSNALKSKGRGFVIDTQDKKTWFGKAVQALDNSYDRVHAVFDRNMELKSITLYSKEGVKKANQETVEKRCEKLNLLLIYYSQIIHAVIHVYHSLLTAGISQCSFKLKDSCSLKQWARSYLPNVFYKNVQIDSVVFSKDGVFSAGGNFRTDHAAIIKFGNDIITEWGKFGNSDDFIRKFLLKDIRRFKRTKILGQFLKHASLVKDFARDLSHSLRKSNSKKDFRSAELELRKFLPQCGRNVIKKIDNLNSWIEMITITSIFHGSTFSLTRLQMTTPVLKYITKESSYGAIDFKAILVMTSTIMGRVDHHSVFSENDFYLKGLTSERVRNVLNKYNKKSEAIKQRYYKEISRDQDRFNNYGWLYSDFFPYGYDYRQFTKTTYL